MSQRRVKRTSTKNVEDARLFIEGSLQAQVALGYERPPQSVIDGAIASAAKAIGSLRKLGGGGAS